MSSNETGLFLGPPAGWINNTLELSSVHGLWGGHEITLRGDGSTDILLVDKAQHARRFQLALDAEEASGLFGLLAKHNFLALGQHTDAPADRTPDSATTTISLTNGAGQSHQLAYSEHGELGPGLEAIVAALLGLIKRSDGLEPVSEEPYA